MNSTVVLIMTMHRYFLYSFFLLDLKHVPYSSIQLQFFTKRAFLKLCRVVFF